MPNHHAKNTMRTKTTLAVVSTSAMAAGMAHGAIHYTQQNITFPLPSTPNVTPFDVNGDGTNDFNFGFDGANQANFRKPYVQGNTTNSAVLGLTSTNVSNAGPWQDGVPATVFGTKIDASYLTPILTNFGKAFMTQDGSGNPVGGWPLGERTEGYVGVELFDAGASVTNFAWLHMICDGTSSPVMLILVDSGYEETPGMGIVAGATNEVGAPIIYSQPASQPEPWGAKVQLKVVALAEPPPVYQWKARGIGGGVFTNLIDGGLISGTTSTNLTINGFLPPNALEYVAVVSNSLGAATSSPPAALTVAPPTVTPTPQVLFGGFTARFNVSVASGLSPTYQWRKSGIGLPDSGRISGSSTAHLQVSNLQTSDTASYDVVLTQGSLSVTSSVATLSVLPVTGESTYETALLAAGPWAYYRLDEMGDPSTGDVLAYDNIAAYNGIYGTNVPNGFSGMAGPRPSDGFPGFSPTNTAASFVPYTTYDWIPLAPWNLNTDTATMVAWVQPADQQFGSGTVVSAGTTPNTTAGIQYRFQAGDTGNIDVGYIWQEGTASSAVYDSFLLPPFGQWSMVAVVITPRAGTIYLFNTTFVGSATNDGTASFLSFNPFTNQVMPFAVSENIGTDLQDTSGARNFYGAIDEVAVFRRALSQADLQTLFNAALGIAPPPPVSLQIALVGTNVQVTWPSGQLPRGAQRQWALDHQLARRLALHPSAHESFKVLSGTGALSPGWWCLVRTAVGVGTPAAFYFLLA